MDAIVVGIDVSKARLDVHVHPMDESFAVGNDEAGVEALATRLGRIEGLRTIGVEASGRYERLAVAALAEAGLPVVVLNPAQVRHHGMAIGLRAAVRHVTVKVRMGGVALELPHPGSTWPGPGTDLRAFELTRRMLG